MHPARWARQFRRSSSHVRGSPGRGRREAEKGHSGELGGNSRGGNRQQVALEMREGRMINNRFINHEDWGYKFNCNSAWSSSCSCSLSPLLPLSLSLSFPFTRVSSCRYRRGALLFAHKAAERVRIKYDSRRCSRVVSPESFASRRKERRRG